MALVTVHDKPVVGEEMHVFAVIDDFWASDVDEFEEVGFVEFYAV